MLLITGCGRSGTHFTARLLQEIGLDVGHETLGKDGVASWKHIVSRIFVYAAKTGRRKSAMKNSPQRCTTFGIR